ncbi:SPRY domain-containing protein, putative [Eimeria maxima]|uniref:SPRY domain-containing protein, putative n=1 Tax=Eimeria maxima TaxID=5804 RepID=U6LYM7_EIMMA|nr:SPRY domain-containing protein, putative [Eimeria maxima]CDJ56856.1 SPRY domain-containing protein, putative [Eimeria maxima]
MVPPVTAETGSAAAGNEEKNGKTQTAVEEKEVTEKESSASAEEGGSPAADTQQPKESSAEEEKTKDPPASEDTAEKTPAEAAAATTTEATKATAPAAEAAAAADSSKSASASSSTDKGGVQTAESGKEGRGKELLANGLPKIVYDLPTASSGSPTGDSAESWGFGGTGKKSTNRRYLDYGCSFGEGDVIGVAIDLDALTISFQKNTQYLGTAFELPPTVRETGLFPHIYVKNFDFTVNFCESTKYFNPPGPQFKFIGDLPEKDLVPNPVEHPKTVAECEFIMMCGLPACGKTYWIEKHMERHPKKAYVLLGTNAVIDQMKVMGLKRQANYANRWEELMSTATEVFNSLVAYAGTGDVPRNVIIDQTNVFKRARARKVQPFLGWGVRRCVVMVTDEHTLQQRTQKREREEGKMVPVSAVMDMKAAFALPSFDDGFTVIDYVEMPEAESRREIRRINDEGRAFKANNPGMNNRQPKPHIEARGGYGDMDASAAKRHKGENWHGGPQGASYPSWSSGGPQGGQPGGRGTWGAHGQQQQQWGGGGHQGGWNEQQRNSSNGGQGYYSGGHGGYGYGGQQGYDSHYQQHQQQQQQYYGQQQAYDSNYYAQQRQQHGMYDSNRQYGGSEQQQRWQEAYSSGRGWQGPPQHGGGPRGGYYQQGRY